MFGNNTTKVSEIVNSKLKSEYQTQKKENPKCFKEFNPVDIDQTSISVDKSYMYFEMILDTSFLTDASSECIYPSTIAKINLSEISRFIF